MTQSELNNYIEALKDMDWHVRANAARSLGEIGLGARDAVPALIEALDDEDMDLIAVWALGRIGPAAIAAAPAIGRWLKKVDSRCRRMGEIRGQLPYLPEDDRRRFNMEMPYDESQVQASKHR